MKFILGTKEHMTQFFNEDGVVVPATVISVPEATVTHVKSVETDGYDAVQIASGERKEKNINKAQQGHFAGKGNFRFVKEFRLKNGATSELQAGDTLDASVFEAGDVIAVSGVSKGKGFQGVVKRHNFAGAPTSHGHRHDTRRPGSIGATGPQRVFKGTRMAGRTGSDRTTVKNLKVVAVDTKNGQLLVKGALPGRRGTLLEVVSA
ncbi:50S ribosomal protein L3 [Candidatus Campbellbacteria bacterium]|nr:50S ribosomal protein L3 [Candidatus Campbellbacteria bacterium]|tara:strand:- start:120 stop:737 length:618 start_codon:yes stop_codon:yes gene_type:complete